MSVKTVIATLQINREISIRWINNLPRGIYAEGIDRAINIQRICVISKDPALSQLQPVCIQNANFLAQIFINGKAAIKGKSGPEICCVLRVFQHSGHAGSQETLFFVDIGRDGIAHTHARLVRISNFVAGADDGPDPSAIITGWRPLDFKVIVARTKRDIDHFKVAERDTACALTLTDHGVWPHV